MLPSIKLLFADLAPVDFLLNKRSLSLLLRTPQEALELAFKRREGNCQQRIVKYKELIRKAEENKETLFTKRNKVRPFMFLPSLSRLHRFVHPCCHQLMTGDPRELSRTVELTTELTRLAHLVRDSTTSDMDRVVSGA